MQSTNLKFTSGLFILGAALMLLVFSCKTEAAAVGPHTVTIDLNGGGGISDLAPKVDDGATLTLTNPTKDNAVFKGWSTTNDISNLDFTSGSTKVTADIKIYAMFNPLYTVTIDPSDGTLTKVTYQVEKGASLAQLDETPKAALSYQTSIKEYRNTTDGTVFTFGTSTISGPTTLKTVWNIDLKKVRDLLSGGSALSTTGVKWATTGDEINTNLTFKFTSSDPESLSLDYSGSDSGQPVHGTLTLQDRGSDYTVVAKYDPQMDMFLRSTNAIQSLTTTNMVLKDLNSSINTPATYTKQ